MSQLLAIPFEYLVLSGPLIADKQKIFVKSLLCFEI